jgi:hypothetical protein
VHPGETTSFLYDDGTPEEPGTGQLASVTAPGGESLGFGYHGFLLADTTWSETVSGSVSRGLDSFLRLSSETVSRGGYSHTVGFGYDNDGLLTGAGALTLTRDVTNGLLATTALGGVGTTQTYNAFGELASFAASGGLYSETLPVSKTDQRLTETLPAERERLQVEVNWLQKRMDAMEERVTRTWISARRTRDGAHLELGSANFSLTESGIYLRNSRLSPGSRRRPLPGFGRQVLYRTSAIPGQGNGGPARLRGRPRSPLRRRTLPRTSAT